MERKIWKVRSVKPYPEAQNHLFLGEVVAAEVPYVELLCHTLHFGRVVNSAKDVRIGAFERRLVPWQRIEVINQLPQSFDCQGAKLITKGAEVCWSDGHYDCPVVATIPGRPF